MGYSLCQQQQGFTVVEVGVSIYWYAVRIYGPVNSVQKQGHFARGFQCADIHMLLGVYHYYNVRTWWPKALAGAECGLCVRESLWPGTPVSALRITTIRSVSRHHCNFFFSYVRLYW